MGGPVIRRKSHVLAVAVATAICGALAAGQMSVSHAQTASTAGNGQASPAEDDKQKEKEVANENKLQEVVVTGFVSSVQNSIAAQKNSDSIDEVVSAQEIGQLPGTSIADSLGRLPGLAVQMFNGRPQQLSIHGLSADFDITEVNGNIQPSTSNNRDVELNQYPASWFRTIDVHLSPSADIINAGIAGTVDMQTIRPLSEKGPVVSINANYQAIDQKQVDPGAGVSAYGHEVNGIFADQFFNDTFGVAFGVDDEANPANIEHQAPWGYATDPNGNLIIGGSKNYNIADLLDRKAYFATFQFKPSGAFSSTLDLMEENTNETQQAKGAELPLAQGSGFTEMPGTTVNGFDETGTFGDIYPVIRNDYNHYQGRLYNILSHNDLKITDSWKVDLDGGYSRAESDNLFLEAYSGTGYDGPLNESTVAGQTVPFREAGSGELYLYPSPGLNGSNVVLTDPQGWGAGANLVQAGFINEPHTEDYIGHATLSTTYAFSGGPLSSIEVGIDRQHRRKDYLTNQDYLVLPGGPSLLLNQGARQTAPIPASALEGAGDPLAFMGVGPQVLYNPFSLIGSGALVEYPTALSSIAEPPDWVVNENDTTGYFQLNLQTNLTSNVGLRGNIGLQFAHTGQTSDGQRVAPGSATGTPLLLPVFGGTNYNRYLPSLNLVFSLPQDNDVRFSAARTMARPRMDYMSAGVGVTTNPTGLTLKDPNLSYFAGTGGNPELLPTMANNFNLSLEHYFSGSNSYNCTNNQNKSSALCSSGGAGYVQLAAYYLRLTDYIDPNAASLYNFAPFVPGYLSTAQQQQLGTTYGIMTIPQNDGSGHIEGEQLATNLPFGSFLPWGWVNGFGILASAARTLSSVYYPGNNAPVTVEGLSKWTENITLYYQYRGFQVDVNENMRSPYLGEVFGISATRVEQMVKAQATLDAQIAYAFNSGVLKGLTLIATGSNLTRQDFQTYQNNDPRQVIEWEMYPRLYTLGFSYDFQLHH